MSLFRTIGLSLVMLHGVGALALDVSVYNPIVSFCGQPTGLLQALISGGVPPYTVLWSNGGTTEIITELAPGTYSVTVTDFEGTQATAQGDVIVQSLLQGGQTYANLAHCPGAYPMVDLTLHNQAQWGVPVYGSPPFTLTGPAEVVSTTAVQCVNCQSMDSLIRVEMNVAPGSFQTITWTDAGGCPGESMVIMSTEAVWPQVQAYGVQGACSNGANGSFSVTVDGGSQFLLVQVFDPQWDLISQSAPGSQSHGLLEAGDYHVVVITESSGPTDDELCADTTTVTIPDLGPGCGNVSGLVFIDGNASCTWGPGENLLRQAIVEITPGPYYASTNNMGSYSANLPLGTYDHTIIHPGAQQECPGPFTLTAVQGLITEPIGCSSLFPLDVQVTMANDPARPGFDFEYALNLRNNTAANAGASTLTLVFDANLVYGSAFPAPSSVAGNTLTWNLNGVNAYANTTYHVYFTVPPDVGLIGTTLNSAASISTANTDAFPSNNTWNSAQIITASFDPNSKEARTSSGWSDEVYFIDVDQWIDYTLNFQNTGTDTAFLVVVTDTLPGTLDPASLQVGAASDPFTWGLAGAGILAFNFANIQLPDSNVNESASHGFVSFRIKPRQPLLPGTVIENTANIFFDYNPPVITEPSVLTAEFSTGTRERGQGRLLLQPNPASERLMVTSSRTIDVITILAADGREVMSRSVRSPNSTIDVSRLRAGSYFLVATMNNGSVVRERFVKQ